MKQNVKIVFDRKKQVEKTGMGKIELFIYLSRGEKKYEVVGISTTDSWESDALSKNIQAKMKHYEQIINAMKMLGEEMTVENFNQHVLAEENPTKSENKVLFNGHDQRQNFVEWCRERLEQENLAKNSIKDINVALNFVESSGLLKTFADLTVANVVAFDNWLRLPKNKSDYTIHGYHKKIGKYCRLLWRLDMISSNPYDHVKFPKGSNKERNPLTEDELIRMRNLKCKGHLDRARDLFIFMAYTGLAFADMEIFDFDTMTEKREDYTYIDGERVKTGSNYFTPILPPAMEVLKKYDYKLPVRSNQKINDYLHIIESDLHLNKPVTCHIGRHSFATLMLSYGFTLEEVKKMLGHKDIKTTQIYAKLSSSVVEKSVKKKLKKLK